MKSCHRWLSRFINQSTRLVPSSCGKHKNFSTERKLNVAVIGGGRIGQVHMETLSFHTPLAKPVMIVDFIEKVAKSTAEKFGVEKYSTDFKDVLKDPNIEAVWICSPSSQHSEQIKALASAGKHIFCEKPLAITLKEAEEVISAVEKAKVKMMLAFQRRFDPNFARAKQCIQSGAVGDVYAVHLVSRDPAPPPMDYIKNSGGLHNDMAIHDFDIARFMTGSECEEITAYGACRVDPKIASEGNDIDTAITLLKVSYGLEYIHIFWQSTCNHSLRMVLFVRLTIVVNHLRDMINEWKFLVPKASFVLGTTFPIMSLLKMRSPFEEVIFPLTSLWIGKRLQNLQLESSQCF